MKQDQIHIAFAGQPNSGKSTLFNMMTGARQHVANYPGITVEKKTGNYQAFGQSVLITDLPGTYSLTSYSPEERVSRNFILFEKPNLLVNITDASNLERHLYLTFQLLEMQCPVIMYLNKTDIATYQGLKIDIDKLSQTLGIPIIAGSAKRKEHAQELKQCIAETTGHTQNPYMLSYGKDMEACLAAIVERLQKAQKNAEDAVPLRWLAIKLCENDSAVRNEQKEKFEEFDSILQYISELEAQHKEKHKHSFEIEIALARAGAAKKIIADCVTKVAADKKTVERVRLKRRIFEGLSALTLFFVTFQILDAVLVMFPGVFQHNSVRLCINLLLSGIFTGGAAFIYVKGGENAVNATDRVDKVLCHRVFGILILVELVLVFYWITVILGYKMTDKVFPVFKFFRSIVSQLIPAQGLISEGLLRGLFLNGIIDGAIMILNYVPIFFCLFALIAFLEDVGYMARLAFIMDRILRKFGLHGQSTLPMILSGVIMGGCVVPGVMSTRTIRDNKSRLVTILILPLLNCMAKIPFYVLITGIFFVRYQWLVLGGISFITLLVALIVAKYFSLYVVQGTPEPFVLELPAYSLPTVRGVLTRTFERLWSFIKKVATTVVAVSVVIWAGVSFPAMGEKEQAVFNTEKDTYIHNFVRSLNNSYAPYFASEKGFLDYQNLTERMYLLETLTSFGGEKAVARSMNRLFLENPEMTKIALRGKLELGDTIHAFKDYFTRYAAAEKDFINAYAQTPDFQKPIMKSAFYGYWQRMNPFFFAIVRTGSISISGTSVVDRDAAAMTRSLRTAFADLKLISVHYHRETLEHSALGYLGKGMEPVTKYAGFDWKINIAILGSFAAKEALVSTLGTIYSVESASEDSGKLLEARIQDKETGMTPLDGLTIMILIALFPPCIATMIATKTETQSIGWTAFSVIYPVVLSSLVAVFVFQFGRLLGF
ncbi:ferrous iron transport protein B [Treponema phagedenis]|uniref:Ferrous iron transport protein B n=1 Tax=Treponema phagedenis TaxID=162 RepID=A0A0B7GZN9_TREPH|nr:ferrous iron transport protein B [Treponema phagedenis]NVP24481.1 ferrous iron transport protein B [Treponema phagedenis]QEK01352.1 ferrous iron transport protein B [Treponema phagedenis]QKS92725.1 ferrous iron transport protein B [Treponema phagedenis]QLC58689.1 ferrous iron transport protein B [Treponema phagedenis]QSH95836.1 ferrous iron transport protein B [Treponema phagedenis]